MRSLLTRIWLFLGKWLGRLLLAIAANDRATFDKIWGWTRANLMVRDDQLLAWRWDPAHRPAVADINDASDGDILVAWALTDSPRSLPKGMYFCECSSTWTA